MHIALHDSDKTKFPNLALMKLAAHHKTLGDRVSWYTPLLQNQYDKIYSSKVFTYTPVDPYLVQDERLIRGGSGYDMKSVLDVAIEHIFPDYSIYDTEAAYGFLTRGCPNNCPWCIVPSKEGAIRVNTTIHEFWSGQKNCVLLDNNILAHTHGLQQLEEIASLPVRIDCNQGMDARLVTEDIARLLASIKWVKIRFSCDTSSQMPAIETAVTRVRKYMKKRGNFFICVLVKDIPDALKRVLFLRELGCDPFAQPYRDFTSDTVPTKEQRHFARWVNHKAIFKTVSWDNYNRGIHG